MNPKPAGKQLLMVMTAVIVATCAHRAARGESIAWRPTAGGTYAWQIATNWWGNQVPGPADHALLTNTLAGSQTITSALSIAVANLTVNWAGANVGTIQMKSDNTTFTAGDTALIGTQAVFDLAQGGNSANQRLVTLNLLMTGNGRITCAGGGSGSQVVVSNAFSNAAGTVIDGTGRAGLNVLFEADAPVTNNSTLRWTCSSTGGAPALKVKNRNQLVNNGTLGVQYALGGNYFSGGSLTIEATLINNGTVAFTNASTHATGATHNMANLTVASGAAVINNGVWILHARASSQANRVQITQTNGDFVNAGLLSSTIDGSGTTSNTNLFTLSATGGTFTNAPGGEVRVVASSLAIRADQHINAGAISILGASRFLAQTRTGTRGAITNAAGGKVTFTGKGLLQANTIYFASGSSLEVTLSEAAPDGVGRLDVGETLTFEANVPLRVTLAEGVPVTPDVGWVLAQSTNVISGLPVAPSGYQVAVEGDSPMQLVLYPRASRGTVIMIR
jgi:hypothetical protein